MSRAGRKMACAIVAAALGATASGCSKQPEFDLIIHGGSVIDGTGAKAQQVDVAIKGDRIVAIGNLTGRRASESIDASAAVVAPGFIDAQSRSGVSLLADGFGESHLRQGITSEILADDSPAFWTASPASADTLRRQGVAFNWTGLNGYFSTLASRGTAANVGTLAPLSRAPAGGSAAGAFVDSALRDGAFGIVDDTHADLADLTAAAAVAGRHDATLMTSVDSPVATTDEGLASVSGPARRIVISGLAQLPPGASIDDLIRRMAAASRRQIAVYGALAPYPAVPGGDDTIVRDALRFGGVLIGTNTAAVSASTAPADTPPAAFGAFPRLLGQLSRDDRAIDLVEAIRRTTSMAASVFRIAQRGIIRENYFADIVIFDPRSIADRATLEKPNTYPAGIEYVIVNGVVTVTPRGLTGARPGHRLLHR